MAKTTYHEEDILARSLSKEETLVQNALLTNGCVTVFNEFGVKVELCWELNGTQLCVNGKLSAFGQNINFGKACLAPGKSTTLNGSIDSVAKVEITLTFQTDPLGICFQAKGCAKPFIGSWHCADTGQHCINI